MLYSNDGKGFQIDSQGSICPQSKQEPTITQVTAVQAMVPACKRASDQARRITKSQKYSSVCTVIHSTADSANIAGEKGGGQ